MRSLLFHCKNYGTKIKRMANRPKGIIPENVKEKEQKCKDCIVVLVTIEKGDNINKSVSELVREIKIMSREVKRREVVILPFAHLSNNLASVKEGTRALSMLENSLKDELNVVRAHFGSHKELLLHLYGHPGNARYREFY